MKKKIENLGHIELVTQMRILNNTTGINPIELGTEKRKCILTLDDPSTLVYPEGYYWTAENGVTNKGNTHSGRFEGFDLYHLKKVE